MNNRAQDRVGEGRHLLPVVKRAAKAPAVIHRAGAHRVPNSTAGLSTDLRAYYTINSSVFILQKLIWGLLIATCGGAGLFALPYLSTLVELPLSFYRIAGFLFRGICILPIFSWIYWDRYLATLELRADGFRIIRADGVLWRRIDSRLLGIICSVSLQQSLLDKLFNVYEVRLYSISGRMKDNYIPFPDLSRDEALDLERWLSDQMSRQCAPSDDALEKERALSAYSSSSRS